MPIKKKNLILIFLVSVIVSFSFFSIRSATLGEEEFDNNESFVFGESNTVGEIEFSDGLEGDIVQCESNACKTSIDDNIFILDYQNTLVSQNVVLHTDVSLERYLDRDYFEKNSIIELEDSSETVYEIFSIIQVPKTTTKHLQNQFDPNSFQTYLKWINVNSLYYNDLNVETDDKLLTIESPYDSENSLLILTAKLLK